MGLILFWKIYGVYDRGNLPSLIRLMSVLMRIREIKRILRVGNKI
jgi:hypothetical protein